MQRGIADLLSPYAPDWQIALANLGDVLIPLALTLLLMWGLKKLWKKIKKRRLIVSNFKRYKEGLGMWLEIGCDLIPRRINWHMLGFFTPIILVVVVFILGILWGKGWFH